MSEDSYRFTRDFSLYPARKQGVFPITDSDWKRLRRLIKAVIPDNQWYRDLGAGCWGVAASALVAVLAFKATKDLPSWVMPTCVSLLIASFLIGLAFLLAHSTHRQMIRTSADAVLAEMDLIEEGFDRAEKERGGPIILELPDERSPAVTETKTGRHSIQSAKDVRPGELVEHQVFGRGVVVEVRAHNGQDSAVVNFNKVGLKRLLISAANLRRV